LIFWLRVEWEGETLGGFGLDSRRCAPACHVIRRLDFIHDLKQGRLLIVLEEREPCSREAAAKMPRAAGAAANNFPCAMLSVIKSASTRSCWKRTTARLNDVFELGHVAAGQSYSIRRSIARLRELPERLAFSLAIPVQENAPSEEAVFAAVAQRESASDHVFSFGTKSSRRAPRSLE